MFSSSHCISAQPSFQSDRLFWDHGARDASNPFFFLLRDPDDSAGGTPACIARGLALFMSALAEVVGAAMHDDGAAEHALGPNQLDLAVGNGTLAVPLSVGLEVAQIANMTVFVGGGTVLLPKGVDWQSICVSRQFCRLLAKFWMGRKGWKAHGRERFRKRGEFLLWREKGKRENAQWGPALVQPLVLSPNWWTWMPRSAEASEPLMS